jgi:hypothetical protein
MKWSSAVALQELRYFIALTLMKFDITFAEGFDVPKVRVLFALLCNTLMCHQFERDVSAAQT